MLGKGTYYLPTEIKFFISDMISALAACSYNAGVNTDVYQ